MFSEVIKLNVLIFDVMQKGALPTYFHDPIMKEPHVHGWLMSHRFSQHVLVLYCTAHLKYH